MLEQKHFPRTRAQLLSMCPPTDADAMDKLVERALPAFRAAIGEHEAPWTALIDPYASVAPFLTGKSTEPSQ